MGNETTPLTIFSAIMHHWQESIWNAAVSSTVKNFGQPTEKELAFLYQEVKPFILDLEESLAHLTFHSAFIGFSLRVPRNFTSYVLPVLCRNEDMFKQLDTQDDFCWQTDINGLRVEKKLLKGIEEPQYFVTGAPIDPSLFSKNQ